MEKMKYPPYTDIAYQSASGANRQVSGSHPAALIVVQRRPQGLLCKTFKKTYKVCCTVLYCIFYSPSLRLVRYCGGQQPLGPSKTFENKFLVFPSIM